MKTIKKVSSLILVGGILLTGCSNEAPKKEVKKETAVKEPVKKETPVKKAPVETSPSIDAIFTYLTKSGVKITDKSEQLMASSIGAEEGYSFSTQVADECELYRFKTIEDAEAAKRKLIADGTNADQLYVNGVFY
ncbi:hypothetical protein [Gottfriedia acidiceleris]|uniref:hypothetical protein n=1 Tax=Gottfriedia acidiceleris TaxID=371036 RepID=UPI00101BAEF6|nr:hypothetical protein [Gottfriedia acidiceleris]